MFHIPDRSPISSEFNPIGSGSERVCCRSRNVLIGFYLINTDNYTKTTISTYLQIASILKQSNSYYKKQTDVKLLLFLKMSLKKKQKNLKNLKQIPGCKNESPHILLYTCTVTALCTGQPHNPFIQQYVRRKNSNCTKTAGRDKTSLPVATCAPNCSSAITEPLGWVS